MRVCFTSAASLLLICEAGVDLSCRRFAGLRKGVLDRCNICAILENVIRAHLKIQPSSTA